MKKHDKVRIFLSYARQDKNRVADLHRRLSAAGFRPWVDMENLLPGKLWEPTIQRAIRDADFFVACVSSNSQKRGFLQKEIKNALDIWQEKLPDDIYLIPVRLEDCKVPEDLSAFQWVNLFEPDGWNKLLRAIEAGTKRREGAPPLETSLPELDSKSTELPTPLRGAKAALSPSPAQTRGLPLVTFPSELAGLLCWLSPAAWETLDDNTRRFLITLGIKLEPIVQIIPYTPVPLIIGFECLALGALGENFSQICQQTAGVDPGHLRLLLALAAMKTATRLRTWATEDGNPGARHLLFTLNLDPEMLNCSHLEKFLDRYSHIWENQFLFEVSERTTVSCLARLRELQSDFKLRYCADDYNAWNSDAKNALKKRVEMSKVDNETFRVAMDLRTTQTKAAIAQLSVHKIANKPLIVEGLENEKHLRFLNAHWPHTTHGGLFGQGYMVEPGRPWETWTVDLKKFGLPGGHILNNVAPSGAPV
jgi:EAL domain-containing protein (putative c-di-GMP-specific phosphodiesterase class I)